MPHRIGILGLASFYGPAFARRIADLSNCEIVAASTAGVNDDALTELDRPTSDEFATQFDCPVFDMVEPVLDTSDAVVVATATTRRPNDVVCALDQGVAALSAKPIAADADGARSVARAAAESDAPVMFTTPARFDDAVSEVGNRVAAGAVGEIQAVRAHVRHDRVPAPGIETNAEHAPGEAGSTHAMAIYVADALLWLAPGDPVRTFAEYANVNTPHSEHPDLGTAVTRFEDGVLGTATVTYSTDCREMWGNWEVEVIGNDGILRTTHDGYEGIHWSAGDPDERTATLFGRTTSPVLDRTVNAFLDAINGDRPDAVPTANDIAAAHTLCSAWETAADDDDLVEFDSWSFEE